MKTSEKAIRNPQNIQQIKVLIADDDPPTRILLRAAISQWGYTVVEASNGEEAWDILHQPDPPRLLILDWLMPKLDGITLCARIKQEQLLRTYTILLTQVTGTTNIIKGLEAGADEFLSKPFNMAELRSRLSVGTKIIKFENVLAEQSKKVEKYNMTLKNLSQALSEGEFEQIKAQLTHIIDQAIIPTLGGTFTIEKRSSSEVRLILDLPIKQNKTLEK